MRMDRRAGLLSGNLPSLAEIFAAMVRNNGGSYRDGTSAGDVVANYPKNAISYLMHFDYNQFQIGKLYNDTYTKYFGSAYASVPTLSDYSSTEYRVTLSVRSGVVFTVSIPTFEDSIVEAVLSRAASTTVLNTTSTSRATKYTAETNLTLEGLYAVAFSSSGIFFSISASDDLYTPIFSAGDIVYLRKSGSNVYLSTNGTSNASLYGGSIRRFT